MIKLDETVANKLKLTKAAEAWQELLAEALRRGFYGSVTIELTLQDGTIQQVRRKVERLER